MPFSNVSTAILLAAEAYSSLGYSVIPLLGDLSGDRPKAPAIPWSDYQKRKPRPDELRQWFLEEGYQGLGILTGRISGLVVLDFDSAELFHSFRAQFPDLAEKQVIQTRRGFHIYYRLPAHLSISSRAGQGVDLLSDGRYAVARPTLILGSAYTLYKGGQPHVLTPRDISRITHFLDQHAPRSTPTPVPENAEPQSTKPLLAADLRAIYLYQLKQGRGRNESLFITALNARDHGCSAQTTLEALADLHSKAASKNTRVESQRQRWNEARLTIRSAFSRPARPVRQTAKPSPQLPNRAREALYMLKLTCVIRVIEGLRDKGIQPGQTFTREQACKLLKDVVGRYSIDKALHSVMGKRQPIFERVTPQPPQSCAVSYSHTTESQKCFLGRETKPEKSRFMHTARRYQMPANNDLCRWLGVPASASDALTADDLSSPKKIRQATHRALFQRRPGQYPRRWLAARLGVSARTTQRYDTALKVQVKAMFHETTITWKTLNRIPDFPLDGTFLQDENGKRYPARQPIAAALLQAGRTVIYARQDANFYSLDAPQVVTVQVFARQRHWQAKQEQIEARVAAEQSRIADLPKPPAPVRQPRANLPDPEPAPEATQTKPSDRRSPRRFRYPLPEATQEALAQRVYNALNARVREAKQRISQATVRRCVETHGCTAVEGALKFTLTRRALRQPAGFFLTVLRTGKRG